MKSIIVIILIVVWIGGGLYYLATDPTFGVMFTIVIGGVLWLGMVLQNAVRRSGFSGDFACGDEGEEPDENQDT